MGTIDESVLEVCGEGAKVVVTVDFESSNMVYTQRASAAGSTLERVQHFVSFSVHVGSSFTNFT